MNIVHIKDTDHLSQQRFLRFPFELYRRCPQWVPPLWSSASEIFSRHPFYKHSQSACFMVQSGPANRPEILGRIMVMDNTRYRQYTGQNTAFFGFFECVEDVQAARLLFSAAEEWAKRRGLTRMIGPRGLIGSDSSGILVEGFEHRPALQVSYNLPYYDDLLRAAGFCKDTDHLSGYLPASHQLPERLLHLADQVRRRRNFTVLSFRSKKELRRWAPRVTAVHARAFAETHSFYPPTPAEMEHVISSLLSVADPRLIKLVLKEDQVVGFVLAYPDISQAIQRCRGQLFPFGWLVLLTEPKRTQWVNVNGVGLLPEVQGLGGNLLLYTELQKSIQALHFKHVEIVMVNEKNINSRADMEAIGVRWYKRHRCYWKNL